MMLPFHAHGGVITLESNNEWRSVNFYSGALVPGVQLSSDTAINTGLRIDVTCPAPNVDVIPSYSFEFPACATPPCLSAPVTLTMPTISAWQDPYRCAAMLHTNDNPSQAWELQDNSYWPILYVKGAPTLSTSILQGEWTRGRSSAVYLVLPANNPTISLSSPLSMTFSCKDAAGINLFTSSSYVFSWPAGREGRSDPITVSVSSSAAFGTCSCSVSNVNGIAGASLSISPQLQIVSAPVWTLSGLTPGAKYAIGSGPRTLTMRSTVSTPYDYFPRAHLQCSNTTWGPKSFSLPRNKYDLTPSTISLFTATNAGTSTCSLSFDPSGDPNFGQVSFAGGDVFTIEIIDAPTVQLGINNTLVGAFYPGNSTTVELRLSLVPVNTVVIDFTCTSASGIAVLTQNPVTFVFNTGTNTVSREVLFSTHALAGPVSCNAASASGTYDVNFTPLTSNFPDLSVTVLPVPNIRCVNTSSLNSALARTRIIQVQLESSLPPMHGTAQVRMHCQRDGVPTFETVALNFTFDQGSQLSNVIEARVADMAALSLQTCTMESTIHGDPLFDLARFTPPNSLHVLPLPVLTLRSSSTMEPLTGWIPIGRTLPDPFHVSAPDEYRNVAPPANLFLECVSVSNDSASTMQPASQQLHFSSMPSSNEFNLTVSSTSAVGIQTCRVRVDTTDDARDRNFDLVQLAGVNGFGVYIPPVLSLPFPDNGTVVQGSNWTLRVTTDTTPLDLVTVDLACSDHGHGYLLETFWFTPGNRTALLAPQQLSWDSIYPVEWITCTLSPSSETRDERFLNVDVSRSFRLRLANASFHTLHIVDSPDLDAPILADHNETITLSVSHPPSTRSCIAINCVNLDGTGNIPEVGICFEAGSDEASVDLFTDGSSGKYECSFSYEVDLTSDPNFVAGKLPSTPIQFVLENSRADDNCTAPTCSAVYAGSYTHWVTILLTLTSTLSAVLVYAVL